MTGILNSSKHLAVSTRTKIGLIGIVLLAVGGFVRWFPHESLANSETLQAACIRIGAVMCVLWIAYPEVIKLPTWISAATFLAAPVLAWKPRVALLVVPLLFVLWLLYPKSKKQEDQNSPQ